MGLNAPTSRLTEDAPDQGRRDLLKLAGLAAMVAPALGVAAKLGRAEAADVLTEDLPPNQHKIAEFSIDEKHNAFAALDEKATVAALQDATTGPVTKLQLEQRAFAALEEGQFDKAQEFASLSGGTSLTQLARLTGKDDMLQLALANEASDTTTQLAAGEPDPNAVVLQQVSTGGAARRRTDSFRSSLDTSLEGARERLNFAALKLAEQHVGESFAKYSRDPSVTADRKIKEGIADAVLAYTGPSTREQYAQDLNATRGVLWFVVEQVALVNGKRMDGDLPKRSLRLFSREDGSMIKDDPNTELPEALAIRSKARVDPDASTNAYRPQDSVGVTFLILPEPGYQVYARPGEGFTDAHSVFFNNPGAARLTEQYVRAHGIDPVAFAKQVANAKIADGNGTAEKYLALTIPSNPTRVASLSGMAVNTPQLETPGYIPYVMEYAPAAQQNDGGAGGAGGAGAGAGAGAGGAGGAGGGGGGGGGGGAG